MVLPGAESRLGKTSERDGMTDRQTDRQNYSS